MVAEHYDNISIPIYDINIYIWYTECYDDDDDEWMNEWVREFWVD